MTTVNILQLETADLGTLEVDNDTWVPYMDLFGETPYIPTVVRMGADDYGYVCSFMIFGHSADMPKKIRELKAAGKKVLVLQRGATGSGNSDRYLVFASPA